MGSKIKFLKIRDVKDPFRANKYDAGIDFFVPKFTEEFKYDLCKKNTYLDYSNFQNNGITAFFLPPHEKILIPSGIKCQMSLPNKALIAFNKSGIASKFGLVVGACVVDYEYQGEIHINMINTSKNNILIEEDMKLVQFVELPVFNSNIEFVQNETELFKGKITSRGESGFGASDNSK
jgi:dUTP pyrophosphatase